MQNCGYDGQFLVYFLRLPEGRSWVTQLPQRNTQAYGHLFSIDLYQQLWDGKVEPEKEDIAMFS